MSHTFHIPVLGLGFSIDTPLKVARYGISSVMSIVDDELIERIRQYHCLQNDVPYIAIKKAETDYRARRITAYLNLVKQLVDKQFEDLQSHGFEQGTDLHRYFDLLPETSQLKQGFDLMMEYPEGVRKKIFENILRQKMVKGAIDVNIMAKVDKMNFDADGNYTGDDQTDALAALRGFAESELSASVVLSAGMNPRLYSYIDGFNDFFPDANGTIKKKIILKVSDFRSAFIQAKFLAKKGLWVSEFRIESGLNCGGHAFATEGYLLGPILEEFKERRGAMREELSGLFNTALINKNMTIDEMPTQRITVQGGIGTAEENEFLIRYYQLDGTGWGSPFLLVPEATNVDDETLTKLAASKEDDYYVSNASPLGILFNNFKGSTNNDLRLSRMEQNRPGSPCTKKFLQSNTEFTNKPICTASREYQNLKIKELNELELSEAEHGKQLAIITEKICLCEGLCSSAYVKYDIIKPKETKAVAVCPGPNLAYFKRVFSLEEMVGHIYGKLNLLSDVLRPHMFLKELELYISHLQKAIEIHNGLISMKERSRLSKFKEQLALGISYYHKLFMATPAFSDLLNEKAKLLEALAI